MENPVDTVEELGAARQIAENLTTEDGHSQPARGYEISASAFRLVPTPPLYGRPLLDDDEDPGAAAVIVIGEDLWKARFKTNRGAGQVRFPEMNISPQASGSSRVRPRSARRRFGRSCSDGSTRIRM